MRTNNTKIIAFYLPQFHPTQINDKYRGKGFTEWTNVAKAKPLFKGHYQPQIPMDLGFYDLRLDDIRIEQAKLAMECGVDCFCYWNYWFGNGESVLDMPLKRLLSNKNINFPFCVGWANHDWSNKTWVKSNNYKKDIVFLKQKYLGVDDYTAYFFKLLPYFKDNRYFKIENRNLFYIYDPDSIPDVGLFISLWNKLAIDNGLNGFYFVCRADYCGKATILKSSKFINMGFERFNHYIKLGFDAVNSYNYRRAEYIVDGYISKLLRNIKKRVFGFALNIHDYGKIMENYFTKEDHLNYVFPTIMPRKDRTPRSGRNALVYKDSTPDKFKKSVINCLNIVEKKPVSSRIIFLDSWNERGEGSYMEPDLKYKHGYLDALCEALNEKRN